MGTSAFAFLIFTSSFMLGLLAGASGLNFIAIGEADGKQYFADMDSLRGLPIGRSIGLCKDNQMNIATVNSKAQNDVLHSFILELINDGYDTRPLWLGGTDLGSEGSWYWHTTREPFNYTNWQAGLPIPADGTSNCMYFTDNGEWFNLPCCAVGFRTVCEI